MNASTSKGLKPQPSDDQLANEVAAYWTRLAYESVIAFTRAQSEATLLVERGWLARDDQRLTITDLGYSSSAIRASRSCGAPPALPGS